MKKELSLRLQFKNFLILFYNIDFHADSQVRKNSRCNSLR